MIKVGLTGGIASGKTKVAKWFTEKGFTVFDADQSAHRFLAKQSMIDLLKKEFGEEIIENGLINRSRLGNIVFSDAKALMRLEELVHPLVQEEMLEQCKKSELLNEKLIILDIPLLFETAWDKFVDEVWLVYVQPQIQVTRLMSRNSCSQEEAKKRIAVQMVAAVFAYLSASAIYH